MKRIALLIASLLAPAGCSLPTSPSDAAAEAAQARAALEAASHPVAAHGQDLN